MKSIVTLGSLHLTGGEGPLLAGRRKILALLACIVRQSPEKVARSTLTRLFWPDRNENHAKQSLRQALAELRAVFGEVLESDTETVRIAPEGCALDVRDFEDSVRLERWEEAAARWGGDFLHGLESVGGEEWATWLAGQRQGLRSEAARAFESLHAVAERREDLKATLDWAHKWCDVAPLDERACAARIRAQVRVGRPVDAAVCYESFVRRLHAEAHTAPSPEFEALRQDFAANRSAPVDKVVVRGTVTLSGLAQLSVDARSVAEAAAVIDGAVKPTTLQAISGISSFSFRAAVAELAEHGIIHAREDGLLEFTSDANRQRVSSVIAGDRRQNFQRLIAAHLGTPIAAVPVVPAERRRRPIPTPRTAPRLRTWLTAATVVVASLAGARWAVRVATAGTLELAPGSTVMLAQLGDESDPALAGALNTAAALGLRQSRHVAVYLPAARANDSSRHVAVAARTARLRDLARREGIPRIIALDVQRTDSVLRLAATFIDGASGEVLDEETVDTRRGQLVDDLDRLLRKVRVALGEAEEVVRDSSRPLRDVASSSIDALSAYADGLTAWGAEQPDKARAAWLRALTQDSTFALVELALANDAFGRAENAEGDRWARRAVTHAARLTALDALRAREMVAMRDGRLDEAATLAEEVAKRAPSGQSWFDVASVRLAAGRCAEAQPALERALAIDSVLTRARLALADCAVEQGNASVALRTIEAARRIDREALGDVEYARRRGVALARANRFADAEASFRDMLRGATTEDSAQGLRLTAQLAMLQGRYGDALQSLQAATALYRRSGNAGEWFTNLILEANAFVAIGGRTRASELIDEAYAVATARGIAPTGYFQVGHLMARIGRINGAREALRVATLRADSESNADQWALRLLTASVNIVERNGPDALVAIDQPAAPLLLEPFRLALTADANAMVGQHDAALAAAKRLNQEWHFGGDAQDEWLRAELRVARVTEAAGDTVAARTAYRKYIERWKDADVFLVELAAAQRGLVRLGGGTIASVSPSARNVSRP